MIRDYSLLTIGVAAVLALALAGELTPAALTALLGGSGIGALGRVRDAVERHRHRGRE